MPKRAVRLIRAPEIGARHQVGDAQAVRVVAIDEGLAPGEVPGAGEGDERERELRPFGQRLLAEEVLSRGEDAPALFVMRAGRDLPPSWQIGVAPET